MAYYADVIIDISKEKLDHTFQYKIPEDLAGQIYPGVQVNLPFGRGNRMVCGFVTEVTDYAKYDADKIKEIDSIVKESVAIETHLIALASWMRKNYGSTMNQALKTVIPVKQKTKAKERRIICLCAEEEAAKDQLAVFFKKHHTARARLLEELLVHPEISYEIVTQKLNVSSSVIRALEEKGLLKVRLESEYRNPVGHIERKEHKISLNGQQKKAVEEILCGMQKGVCRTYLLHGVTGSGKTEVYMELIADVIKNGRQAIMLIPEIALTYQTVMRFIAKFGNRVSIINSRMSKGERYDQFLRAKNGETDIMIGPRSALFTPFCRLGLIIIDEEHEGSYKSETVPKYHARETAIERAKMSDAFVVLGSATPSVDSYYRAKAGEYKLVEMERRVEGRPLPVCSVVDLREELKCGNRSILSQKLQDLIDRKSVV